MATTLRWARRTDVRRSLRAPRSTVSASHRGPRGRPAGRPGGEVAAWASLCRGIRRVHQLGHAAAASYSWMSPSSRSHRWVEAAELTGPLRAGGLWLGSGARRSSARCGLCSLRPGLWHWEAPHPKVPASFRERDVARIRVTTPCPLVPEPSVIPAPLLRSPRSGS